MHGSRAVCHLIAIGVCAYNSPPMKSAVDRQFLVLFENADASALARLSTTVLGGILARAPKEQIKLLRTLRAVRDTTTFKDAADLLGVSEGALYKRLDKAAGLLALDVANPSDRALIELSLFAWELSGRD